MRERRWLQAVALQFWINGVIFASFIPRLPEIRDRIAVDLRTLGLLLTVGSVGGLVGSAACGPLIERFGTKRSMVGGALGLIAALPVIGLAEGPLVFLLGLLLLQFFDVVTDVAMNLQASWLSARRAVPVMSRLHGLWSVGTVFGGVGATVAASNISLRDHLLIVAAVLLVTLSYVAPGLLSKDEPATEAPDEGTSSASQRRAGLVFGGLALCAISLEMVPADWATLRLVDDLDLSAGRAGLGFVAATTGMVIGRFSGDTLTSRWGGARLARVAILAAAVGTAVGSLAPTAGISLIGFFVAGLGAAVLFPRLYDDAAQAPGRPAALLGAMTAGIRVGAFLIPLSVGSLAATASLDVGAAMVIVTVPAGLAMLILRARGA